jgi:purine-binding chemotaxis protein CheW
MDDRSRGMSDGSTVDLACFEVADGLYAIEISSVREIVRMPEVTRLPNAPGLIEGIVDLRGAVIPVIDLAHALGRGRSHSGPGSRLVVLEVDGLAFGLQVDRATEVLSIDSDRLDEVPEIANQPGSDSVRHVVRRSGESPVLILALESLIERVHRSSKPDASGSAPPADAIEEVA